MKNKWQFCLATGMSPGDYDDMTVEDYIVASKVWTDMNKKGGKTTY